MWYKGYEEERYYVRESVWPIKREYLIEAWHYVKWLSIDVPGQTNGADSPATSQSEHTRNGGGGLGGEDIGRIVALQLFNNNINNNANEHLIFRSIGTE